MRLQRAIQYQILPRILCISSCGHCKLCTHCRPEMPNQLANAGKKGSIFVAYRPRIQDCSLSRRSAELRTASKFHPWLSGGPSPCWTESDFDNRNHCNCISMRISLNDSGQFLEIHAVFEYNLAFNCFSIRILRIYGKYNSGRLIFDYDLFNARRGYFQL